LAGKNRICPTPEKFITFITFTTFTTFEPFIPMLCTVTREKVSFRGTAHCTSLHLQNLVVFRLGAGRIEIPCLPAWNDTFTNLVY
jgi:hypothetical protein